MDRDTKFTEAFRNTLERAGVEPVRCPPQAPRCNAYAERFVRSIKDESLARLCHHVLCLLLQLLLILAAIRYYRGRSEPLNNPSFWTTLVVIKGVMLLLIVGNLAQMAVWAWLFLMLGEFQQFDAAFYHSAGNFATLGYEDFIMSERHRILGPLEAFNGVLMIGLSTAALTTVFQDAIKKTLQAWHG